MKRIGINKELTLTEESANYLITHQQNQRSTISRHINALAKLLSRTGWRNDQRICITEDRYLINGLQRLSAIIKLRDFGWKIPVTVFSKSELTVDVIESFNIQKNDDPSRLMSRLYGWKDSRITTISHVIFRCIGMQSNVTTNDLFDIYEHLKESIDHVIDVKEVHKKGEKKIHCEVMVAAVCCIASGMSAELYKKIATEYLNHNESGPFWKAMREWDCHWRSMRQGDGSNLEREPGDIITRVAVRFNAMMEMSSGKKITPIKRIKDSEKSRITKRLRELLKKATEF